jgi:ATP-binding cassette subfamily F protein uup
MRRVPLGHGAIKRAQIGWRLALPTQIAGLNAILADPDLYACDPGRFGATIQALAMAQDELATAEEQWLILEMLREEIDDAERKS